MKQSLIKELKEAGQDYEFYPTTKEILKAKGRTICVHVYSLSKFFSHRRKYYLLLKSKKGNYDKNAFYVGKGNYRRFQITRRFYNRITDLNNKEKLI